MSLFRQDVLKGRVAFVTGGGSGICKAMTDRPMVHDADGGQGLGGTAATTMTT